MQEREQAARRTETTYRRMIDNRQHPFIAEQFTAILRCLHPDSRDAAQPSGWPKPFALLNEKKLQLTGQE